MLEYSLIEQIFNELDKYERDPVKKPFMVVSMHAN